MAVQPQAALKPLTVLELNTRIHDLLASRFQEVLVKGEVSGVSSSRGHIWFTLKDGAAMVGAVVFSSTARRLPLLPENGQELVVSALVDYHVASGRLTLVVNRLEYDGAGKLRQAIELLKRRLDAEGAFRPERKRPLPFLPACVALITSPSGAVLQDLQQTIWERFPNQRLLLYPAQVQGTASQRSIVVALRQCNRDRVADVCVVARGGGSFEELMAFNQESVIRAIQAMRIPVVTALGHTSDRTLADLVADREARTPTAAAELVVPNKRDLRRFLDERRERLQRAGRNHLRRPEHELDRRQRDLARLANRLVPARQERLALLTRLLQEREPHAALRARLQALGQLNVRYGRALAGVQLRITAERSRVERTAHQGASEVGRSLKERGRGLDERAARLRALGPAQTLARGYSICREVPSGQVVRRAAERRPGDQVEVVLASGSLECRVERPQP